MHMTFARTKIVFLALFFLVNVFYFENKKKKKLWNKSNFSLFRLGVTGNQEKLKYEENNSHFLVIIPWQSLNFSSHRDFTLILVSWACVEQNMNKNTNYIRLWGIGS